MNAKYQCFFWGYLFHTGLNMFLQDLRGLDKYIVWVRANWIDLSPWWGFFVMFISITALAYTKYNQSLDLTAKSSGKSA